MTSLSHIVWRRPRVLVLALFLAAAAPAQPTEADKGMHVGNRVAYGVNPTLFALLETSQAARLTWINQQLNPPVPLDPNDNQETVDSLAAFNDPQLPIFLLPTAQGAPGNQGSLGASELVRALLTDHQLVERMAQFWEVHFNTYFFKVKLYFAAQGLGAGPDENYATWFEKADNDFYRDNALGNFSTLLDHTAKSVAMMIYLDNYENTASEPNENWGRELLELFAWGQIWASAPLGVSATNYSQQDVVDVAECFTGWTVIQNPPGIFSFGTVDTDHDMTAKTLFSVSGTPLPIAAGGTALADGTAVINHLASSPRTADFIVRKLMRYFLSDTAPDDQPALLAAATAAWGTNGDIKAVLTVLLTSQVFLDATYAWQQIADPLHFTISMQRSVGAIIDKFGNPLVVNLNRLFRTGEGMLLMGQFLHSFPSPDGFPMASDEQVGSSVYLEHIEFAKQFSDNSGISLILQPHLVVLAGITPGLEQNATAVASFLLQQFFADKALSPLDAGLVAAELQNLPNPVTDPTGYGLQIQSACAFVYGLTHGALK